jgi:transcriptional regulator with XRE-family HTH domain
MLDSNAIKEARKAAGLTQFELAMRVPCQPTTISHYERGVVRKGQPAVLIGIARVLGLPDDAFLPNRVKVPT